MAHNLGIDHDCINDNCIYWDKKNYIGLKEYNGTKCDGYMDYDDKTLGWSGCATRDFKNYVDGVLDFCLDPLHGGIRYLYIVSN